MQNYTEKVEKIKQETTTKRNVWQNTWKAFLVGGLICAFAQGITIILRELTPLTSEDVSIYTVIIMIFLGALLTGVGLYDRIGQFSGCGSIIPITGFANSMASSALESKSEGVILGIITNVFKLAGSVVVTAVVGGIVVALIRYLVGI